MQTWCSLCWMKEGHIQKWMEANECLEWVVEWCKDYITFGKWAKTGKNSTMVLFLLSTYLKPSFLSPPHRVCGSASPPAAQSALWGAPWAWWQPSLVLSGSLLRQRAPAPENHSLSFLTLWELWSHRLSPPADLNWAQLHQSQTGGANADRSRMRQEKNHR